MNNNWISVEDRLPEENKRVLVWMVGYQEHSGVKWSRYGYAWMVRWDSKGNDCDKNGWSDHYRREAQKAIGADWLEVIHWQPLPAPPQEVEG